MSCNDEQSTGMGGNALQNFSLTVLTEITTRLRQLNQRLREHETAHAALLKTVQTMTTIPALDAVEIQLNHQLTQIQTAVNEYRDLMDRLPQDNTFLIALVRTTPQVSVMSEEQARTRVLADRRQFEEWREWQRLELDEEQLKDTLESCLDEQRERIRTPE